MVFVVKWARKLRRALANMTGLGEPSDYLVRDIMRMQRYRDRGKRWRTLLMSRLIYKRYKCCIAIGATIAPGILFPHPVGIVIGEGAVIESGCTIYQGVTLGRAQKNISAYPRLKNDCVIYANATLLGDITLASGTVVGANAVVTKGSARENDVLVGVPAHSIFDC